MLIKKEQMFFIYYDVYAKCFVYSIHDDDFIIRNMISIEKKTYFSSFALLLLDNNKHVLSSKQKNKM